jgi:hypothetical protein
MASNGQQQQHRHQNTTPYYSEFMRNDGDEHDDEHDHEDFECVDDGSTTPPTPYWMKDGDSDDGDEEEEEIIPAAAPSSAASDTSDTSIDYNPNDPLRYCLQTGLISAGEYEKWKIVNETPETPTATSKPKRPFIDYGPLYESDSDSSDDAESSIVYGHGYITQFPCRRVQPMGGFVYDPWFPNPDPTSQKHYTNLASSVRIMMSQFVVSEESEDGATETRLKPAFQLKLSWERFMTRCRAAGTPPPMQNFWETHSLYIYHALHELAAIHTKCFKGSARFSNIINDTPEFHTTPLETLEYTFETIGRMCRCIADDFNTQTVVNYVEEFIRALYTELRFIELVEVRVEEFIDAEYDKYIASQSQNQ